MNLLEATGLSCFVYLFAGSVVSAIVRGAPGEGDPPITRFVCTYVSILCWPVFVLELFSPDIEELLAGDEDDLEA